MFWWWLVASHPGSYVTREEFYHIRLPNLQIRAFVTFFWKPASQQLHHGRFSHLRQTWRSLKFICNFIGYYPCHMWPHLWKLWCWFWPKWGEMPVLCLFSGRSKKLLPLFFLTEVWWVSAMSPEFLIWSLWSRS